MKQLTAILVIFLASTAYAGQVLCYNQDGTIKNYNANSSPIEGCLYFSIPPMNQQSYELIEDLFKRVPEKHIKVSNELPLEMTQAEKTIVDTAEASTAQAILDEARQNAGSILVNAQITDFQLIQLDQAIDSIQTIDETKNFLKKLMRGLIKLDEATQ